MNQALILKTKTDPQTTGKLFLSNSVGAIVDTSTSGMLVSKKHGLLLLQNQDCQFYNPHIVVAAIDETVCYAQAEYQLSSHSYKDGIFPDGIKYISHAQHYPYPKIIYAMGAIELEKEYWLDKKTTTLHIKYELTESYGDVMLELRPLLSFRRINDHLIHQLPLAPSIYKNRNSIFFKSGLNHPSVHFSATGKMTYSGNPVWYNNFYYAKDADSEEQTEDLFMPFCLQIPLKVSQEMILSVHLN